MARRSLSPLVLGLLLAAFMVGWRSESVSFFPVNMTLADGRLFVSDLNAGVRVFDMADPAAPVEIQTIPLYGNRGTAVKDGILYASAYDALVVFKPGAAGYEEIARLEPEYDDFGFGGGLTGFKGPAGFDSGFGCACQSNDEVPLTSPGGSSSYATFAVIGDYLYRVDYTDLVTYDISNAEKPVELKRKSIGWEIETVFPTEAYLFIGGTRGMYIFDRSTPDAPREIARVEHVRACDPVVVAGPVAWVTLRGNAGCGNTPDVLLAIDVSNPTAPRLIREQSVTTPYGLVIRDPYLYVSNGRSGYTLFDVERPAEPVVAGEWTDIATRDFLWEGDYLLVLGDAGLHVYDVRDPRNPVLLSTVSPGAS